MKNVILLTLLLFSSSEQLSAQDGTYLNRDEIIKLLTGNSVSGNWNGRPFKQNIHGSGLVDVNFNGSRYKISWKINSKNEYCEDWDELGWYCSRLKKLTNRHILSIRKHGSKIIESQWQLHQGMIDLKLTN